MPRTKKTQGGDHDHVDNRKESKKLSSPLDIVEFYCLTCKKKRKLRGRSDIKIVTAKNGRKMAQSFCNKEKDSTCTRKLVKFLSNEQAEHLSHLKKRRKPHADI